MMKLASKLPHLLSCSSILRFSNLITVGAPVLTKASPGIMSKSRDKNGATPGGAEGGAAESCPEDMSFDWDSLRKMFNPRVFATPVIHGNTIFLVGGCDQMGQPVDTFEKFEKKRWHSLPSMPTKRANPAVGLVKDKIVVVGGVGTGQKPVTAVEVYDINEGKWIQMESLLEGLLGVSSVVRDGKVLAVGGMATDTNPRDYFRSFDVEANRWKALSPLPTPRYATFSFLIKDKFYVIGGRQGKLPCLAFEVYDFKEEKWDKLPDVPSKRVFALYTCTDSHIFSMGGLIQPGTEGFSDACEIFDLEKKQWTIGKPMPTKRGDFAIGILHNKVICAGGLGNAGKPLDVVEAYDLANDSWTKLRSMPSTHCSCAYTLFEGKFYVFGGLTVQGPGTDISDEHPVGSRVDVGNKNAMVIEMHSRGDVLFSYQVRFDDSNKEVMITADESHNEPEAEP